MNIEQLRKYCLSFPGATEDIKWGADLCFCVGEKMFCVTGADSVSSGMSIKCTPAKFDEHELDGLNAKLLHTLDYADAKPRLTKLGIDHGEAFWLAVRGNLERFEIGRAHV